MACDLQAAVVVRHFIVLYFYFQIRQALPDILLATMDTLHNIYKKVRYVWNST